MKLFTATLLGMACASIFAQDQPARDQPAHDQPGQEQPDNRVHFACAAVSPQKIQKCQTTLGNSRVRQLVAGSAYVSAEDFARHAKVGDPWWPAGTGTIVLTLAASDIRQESGIDRLTGQVEIHTTTTTVTADNAIYHSDTGEIEAIGNVLVKPAP